MDLTKYQPKKPLMPSLFSGVKPTLKLPSLSPSPTAPTPMVAPAPVQQTPAVTPAIPTPPKPVVSSKSSSPVVPTPSGTSPSIASIMEGLKGVSSSLASMTPEKPAVPTVDPVQQNISNEEKTIKSLMTPGSEELTTQADLDKLIDSTKTGYLNTENKVIPMEFITGQLSAIEKRATNLAEPLEKKLARLQAQRTSALEVSKFSLDRSDKKVAAESKAKETAFDQDYKNKQLAQIDKKFEEDKRQWGLDHALKEKELAIKQLEANAKAAEASGSGGKAEEQKLSALALAKELRGDATGKGSAVGASLAKLVPFGQSLGLQGDRTAFEAKVDTLKSNLTLENLKLLKGAMSDKDLAFLNSIGSSLNTNMSEDQFNKELDKVIGKLEVATGSAPETMVLNGKVLYLQADGTYE